MEHRGPELGVQVEAPGPTDTGTGSPRANLATTRRGDAPLNNGWPTTPRVR